MFCFFCFVFFAIVTTQSLQKWHCTFLHLCLFSRGLICNNLHVTHVLFSFFVSNVHCLHEASFFPHLRISVLCGGGSMVFILWVPFSAVI